MFLSLFMQKEDSKKKETKEKSSFESQISEESEKPDKKEHDDKKIKPVHVMPAPSIHIDKKFQQEVKHYQKMFDELRYEVSKVVVGQSEVLDFMIEAILSNGHCLVEGIPGIAKTLLLRCLSVVTGCEFKRIQFTPDLLPTDIIGVTAYDDKKGFYTVKGPIFANFVLGDE